FRRHPHCSSTLSPYTTLFRSVLDVGAVGEVGGVVDLDEGHAVLDGLDLAEGIRGDLAAGRDDGGGHARDAGLLRLVAHELVEGADRKSTRLNSSHLGISYAVF